MCWIVFEHVHAHVHDRIVTVYELCVCDYIYVNMYEYVCMYTREGEQEKSSKNESKTIRESYREREIKSKRV